MLRNIPNNYSRDMVIELLDEHGFAGPCRQLTYTRLEDLGPLLTLNRR